MQTLFVSLSFGFGIFGFAATLVWAFRIQHYVELHGEHSACVVFNSAMLRDYRTARRIADRIGRKPGFLIWFERLSITALVFFISGVFVLLIWNFR
jgi:hypothetical protein